jgi:hypothetical protein
LKKFKTEQYNKYWQNLIPWLGVYQIIIVIIIIIIEGGDAADDDDDDYCWFSCRR